MDEFILILCKILFLHTPAFGLSQSDPNFKNWEMAGAISYRFKKNYWVGPRTIVSSIFTFFSIDQIQ
jgi:hypothetical protein